ncbi:ATP-binding protein [Phormidium sp. CCY1219]|uniref:ATP-binding protein n=1 Tax=Phormidium sp. CCY1219 TaxID=2886104 RepID=UPI002D1F0BE4|nr:ATP-binding protein [Phormidium sp. CCY1219]MEB3831272.1 response regulator [Phormidium sp. CCY1219]
MKGENAEILIVDDRLENLRLLLNILEREGYVVRCVRSGEMALKVLENTTPDLILLDIQMPEMNGYQICEQLKSNPKTRAIPVIFISVIDETMDKIKAFRVGAVDYIKKPFQVQEVVVRVANQLTIRRLQQQLTYQNERLHAEIRDREAAQQQLQQLNQKLERSNQELEEFAYVVSHDLQAPLGTIASYAELLENRSEEHLDAKAKKYIGNIIGGSLRMQGLIQDLLEYSRLGRSRDKGFEMIDCNRVFALAISNLAQTIRQTQAVVTSEGNLPRVWGNSIRLVQLFQNLISNGIKYHQEGKPPVIRVSAVLQENDWVISVEDNGIGIDPKQQGRIFKIFQRLHTETEYPGSGIGLAICKKIVELHGGKIGLRSLPGEGTTFYFTLPNVNPSRNEKELQCKNHSD